MQLKTSTLIVFAYLYCYGNGTRNLGGNAALLLFQAIQLP